MKRRTALAILALLAFPLFGASDAPKQIVLHARRLLDVRTGNVSDAYIVVEGERIASVTATAPAGATPIDLGNATVLPGLIDCHVHLLNDWDDSSATQYLRLSSPQKTLFGLHYAQDYLHRGFTTLRDAGEGDLSYGQVALRDAIAHGMFEGPRLVVAGFPISPTGGHADVNVLAPDAPPMPKWPNLADTPDEVRVAVRHDLKYGVDWIKLMATGGVSDPLSDYRVQELSDEQLRAAVETAHRAGRKVMAHAEGTAGIIAAVRAGVDSIEHGTILDEEGARLMAEKGTWLVPTLETFQRGLEIGLTQGTEPVMLEKTKSIIGFQKGAFETAVRHHVKIAFGLDDDPKFVTREFSALVAGGLSPLQALQVATVNAAELLGMANDAGSIEKGKYADIIAIDGDPLRDVTATAKIRFVMKGGKIVVRQGS